MRKKLTLILIISVFLFTGTVGASQHGLPNPGLLPGSPFYFLDTLFENIGTFFTFKDKTKAERFLSLAEERLAEAKKLAEQGKSNLAEKTVEKYQKLIDDALAKAQGSGTEKDDMLEKIAEATASHQNILTDISENIPEQAKEAVPNATEKSTEPLLACSEHESEKPQEETTDSSSPPPTAMPAPPTTQLPPPPATGTPAPSPQTSAPVAPPPPLASPVPQPSPAPTLIDGKTWQERLAEAYDRLHTSGSGEHIRKSFPDIALVYTDDAVGTPFPSEIIPFRYYYSSEADTTFNICAVERTVFICKRKLDHLIRQEDVDSGRCELTPIYSLDPRL